MKKSAILLLFASLFSIFALKVDAASRDLVVLIDTGMSMREKKFGNGDVCVYSEVASQVKQFFGRRADKNTNVKVIAVAKHKAQQRLDMSRVLLNIIGGQKPDFTNLTNISACPDEWQGVFGCDTDPNPTDLGLFYNDVFKNARNTIYVIITNSRVNRDRFFNRNRSQRIGALDIERVVFPNNVKAFLITLPTVASCGKNAFMSNECPKYVMRGLTAAWEEASFDPPRGNVAVDFKSGKVVQSVSVTGKAAAGKVTMYAPVALELRAGNLADVEAVSVSKVSSFIRAARIAVEPGKRNIASAIGTVDEPGDYVIAVEILGRNGDVIKKQINFTVIKPISIIGGSNQTESAFGKPIRLVAEAPDFRVKFPAISGAKSVVWKRGGKIFEPEKNNVFTSDATVVAEMNGFDGRKYTQKFIITVADVDFWAKANDTKLLPGQNKEISGVAPFKVTFTSAVSFGVTWYRGDQVFVPAKNGDIFSDSTKVRCVFVHKGKKQEFFLTILVQKKPVPPPAPKPAPQPAPRKPAVPEAPSKPKTVTFTLRSVSANGEVLEMVDGKYLVDMAGADTVEVNFLFKGQLLAINEIKDDNSRRIAVKGKPGKWSYQFDGTPVTLEFTGKNNKVVCALDVKVADDKPIEISDNGGEDSILPYILIAIAAAAGIVFFIFKRLGSCAIKMELDGKACKKMFAPGKYKIDQTLFPECKDSFEVELIMKKEDGEKNYSVKFKLEHTWQLENNYNLQTLDNGSSQELPLGKYKIYTANGDEMELNISTKDDQ